MCSGATRPCTAPSTTPGPALLNDMPAGNVFLSYTAPDEEAATRVCTLLEAEGIGCWLASRDATSSEDKASTTIEAIRRSDLVLLIFSASANSSPYVLREIERAIAYERPVLSIHLDDAVPNPSLEYYLNLWQWLDAPGSLEERREEIVAAVRRQLAGTPGPQLFEPDSPAPSETTEEPEPLQPEDVPAPRRLRSRTWVIAVASAILVAAVSLGLILGLGVTREGHIWTELTPQGARPDARFGHDMVLDSSAGLLMLFGGGAGAKKFNDTWAYDPLANTWSVLAPSGAQPEARDGHAMAYDEGTDQLIMFGGYSGPEDMTGDYHDDTWAYDAKTNAWTKLEPSGAVPPARVGHTMAYDPVTQRTIMFGGQMNGVFADTWAYDAKANAWTKLEPSGARPPARTDPTMAYDPDMHRMIMFGGWGASIKLDDTWAYDAEANAWTKLEPSGAVPPARSGHTMAYDPVTQRTIMFGGDSNGVGLLSDTWAYDSSKNRWTELNSETHPTPRVYLCMAYDPSTERVIMFGGLDRGGARSDTWACTP